MTLILTSLLAFYLAFNLGANDVANSMGTSVGSKAVTLRQALVIAGILEFTGAVLFGQQVSQTLVTKIVNPALFAQTPQLLLIGMVSVLLAGGIWLNVATVLGLPVSSSHAVVGAIAGFGSLALGTQAVDWRSLGIISLTWVVTPVISGAIAASFYSLIQRWILHQPDPLRQLREWIPWLSVLLISVFGVIVLPHFSHPIQQLLARFGVTIPSHDVPLLIVAIASVSLTLFSWKQLDGTGGGQKDETLNLHSPLPTPHPPLPTPEPLFARFQLLSACFVAFAHGSNDVGNAIAPLAAIHFIQTNGSVPLAGFAIPLWILLLGGAGIVAGLAILGGRVIRTIGENITALQPSGGFCAELATATTVLLASQMGLPVSTSHALVGGVVGVGLVRDRRTVQLDTLKTIGLAWIVTIPVSALLAMALFKLNCTILGI